MKETLKAVGFFIMFLLSALPVAAADWSYDFETAKKDIGNQFHEHREVTLNDMVWKIYCVRAITTQWTMPTARVPCAYMGQKPHRTVCPTWR